MDGNNLHQAPLRFEALDLLITAPQSLRSIRHRLSQKTQ
ncbi:Uncharacterised protein [Vibrio cholerae]|nr:Uncharacterised protein [Vibrio cholerae]CSI29088.1 Uncharacterised protein [Vibrio cholerae]CSI46919.1 Uncharacterised protein [Vibrio cholerae]